MRSLLALCALALCTADLRAADLHPPVGTVVVAKDTGRAMIHTGDGHFREYTNGVAAIPVPKAMPTVRGQCACNESCPCPTTGKSCPAHCDVTGAGTGDGLDEVNAKRAARGLRPFLRDEGLTRAAQACAAFRARAGLFGHTSNDFAFVPPGTSCASAGCAAYPASYGWMSCCTYEGYTHAGAAWVTGADGKRYMHLFVRGGSSASEAIPARAPAYLPASLPQSSCPGGNCPAPQQPRRAFGR